MKTYQLKNDLLKRGDDPEGLSWVTWVVEQVVVGALLRPSVLAATVLRDRR